MIDEQLTEAGARDVLHHEIWSTAVTPVVDHANAVAMRDTGARECLEAHSLSHLRVSGQLRTRHLDCDDPVERALQGSINDAHPADAKHISQNVITRDELAASCRVALKIICHGSQR